MVVHHVSPAPHTDRRAPLSIVVIGAPGDRQAFVDAIRALALIRRFSDRMTLIGYGRHRRALTKWVVALQVDDQIVFGEAIAPERGCADAHDVVIACDRAAAAFALSTHGAPLGQVARGDRIALGNALIMPIPVSATYRQVPATVRQRLPR